MDIHRPKSVETWREFAKEVGVIVLGVCIALAGEQAVEWIHWSHEIAETRDALDKEVAYNLGAMRMRQQEAVCIDRRLEQLRVLLRRPAGQAPAPRPPLGQPQLWRPRTNVWQAALAGQVAARMPLQMRLGYAQIYDGFQWYGQKAADESEAWGALGVLDDVDVLGPEDLAALRQAHSRAQVAADKMTGNLPGILAAGARLGVKPAVMQPSAKTAASLKSLCAPAT